MKEPKKEGNHQKKCEPITIYDSERIEDIQCGEKTPPNPMGENEEFPKGQFGKPFSILHRREKNIKKI